MQQVAEFFKVSFKEFETAWKKMYPNAQLSLIEEIYSKIKLPSRATKGSAGYDFYLPTDINLATNQTITFPTGIRVKIEEGWFLGVFPKSGLGFKYRLQLDNTVGIIDSDYYYSDNEGHIFVKLTNDSKHPKLLELKQGQSVCQGIFIPFGITYNDNADGIRNGGFGSTSK